MIDKDVKDSLYDLIFSLDRAGYHERADTLEQIVIRGNLGPEDIEEIKSCDRCIRFHDSHIYKVGSILIQLLEYEHRGIYALSFCDRCREQWFDSRRAFRLRYNTAYNWIAIWSQKLPKI